MRKNRALRFAVGLLLSLCTVGVPAQPFVKILSPQPEECVPGPDVTVRFQAGGMAFGPCGCSIHFMLDNEPFEVQFDPSHPHVFHDVAPGTHTIRAYCADSLHKAVDGSMDMVTFSVAYPNDENRHHFGEPLLTYNLPQGEYRGIDAMDIQVNFLVNGACLSRRGYRVNYYVDGRRYIAYDCTSRNIKGLAPGLHTVRMELVDEKGRRVGGPFNAVERVILLSPEKDPFRVAVGEQPPKQPVITSIHGPATMGAAWIGFDERPARVAPGRAETISVTRPGVAAGRGFTVRDETIDTPEALVEPRGTDVDVSDMPPTSAEVHPSVERDETPVRVYETERVEVAPRETTVDTVSSEEAPRELNAPARGRTFQADNQPTVTTIRIEPPSAPAKPEAETKSDGGPTTTSAQLKKVRVRNGFKAVADATQTTTTKQPAAEVALYHK